MDILVGVLVVASAATPVLALLWLLGWAAKRVGWAAKYLDHGQNVAVGVWVVCMLLVLVAFGYFVLASLGEIGKSVLGGKLP